MNRRQPHLVVPSTDRLLSLCRPISLPVLTSILVHVAYVATSHDPIVGATLLFFYTLGYSTPLLVMSATGGSLLLLPTQTAAAAGDDVEGGDGGEGGMGLVNVGRSVTPLAASVLIWHGTTGFLGCLIGDTCSSVALAPILD